MKPRFASLYTLFLFTLLFSSCQKDALVDPITPSYTTDEPTDLRSSDIDVFEMYVQVDIIQPDCDNDPIMSKDQVEDDDEISKTNGCYGLYGLTSDQGAGWVLDYGRFISNFKLQMDASKNEVFGTIELKFPGEGDMLVLKAYGQISTEASSEGGTTLTVHIISAKGTGRFYNVNFKGTLDIMDADQIFDGDATDYYATLIIKGEFVK